MVREHENNSRGFTLVELILAMALAGIALLGIGMLLFDGQKGWGRIYSRVNASVLTEGQVAGKTFDNLVRKSKKDECVIDANGAWVEVHYYASAASSATDRYALWYLSGNQLKVEHGTLGPKSVASTAILCNYVSACKFQKTGDAVQMKLTLVNGKDQTTTLTSAVLSN